jgi:2-aminoethylphosphonate-pyruvate transaminase
LAAEGGVPARAARYRENHDTLVAGMTELGFAPLIAAAHQSPIITAFLYPSDRDFEWDSFYLAMKSRGFVLYPGKISSAATFRIGNIGHVFPADIRRLLANVREIVSESST